eukprot:Gb_25351 [translate_table: standard]
MNTFEASAFEGNKCLCGFQLDECPQHNPAPPPPSSDGEEESTTLIEDLDDLVSLPGLSLGTVIGFSFILWVIVCWIMEACDGLDLGQIYGQEIDEIQSLTTTTAFERANP